MGEQLMSTMPLPIGSSGVRIARSPMLFAGSIGFFFVFRVALNFLFFQSNPVTGTKLTIALDLAFIFAAIFATTGDHAIAQPFPRTAPVRWIFALLAFSLASIMWTGAESTVAALAYWVGMAADIVIVLLLLRHGDAVHITDGILKGMVWGAAALALVAWCSPATSDLRLGNDEFLHPNTLGLELGIATLIAQYLAPRGTLWKGFSIALGVTLLRTLSKTAIIAFLIAEAWYLMQSKHMSRKAKFQLTAVALIVIACFWSLLTAYIDVYNSTGSGNQAETLTGRTVIWALTLSMGSEKPWFGHGVYSFRSLMPAFGNFQAVHAHNEILQQFFEYGLTGVIIVIGLYWSIYRQARRAPASHLRTLCLTLLIFAVFRGLADTTNFGLSYPIWLITALSVSVAQPDIAEVRP
jgi:O-antigen ligase